MEGMLREFGMGIYTLLYFKWITNKYLVYSIWNSAQCYAIGWMRGEFGEEVDTCICMTEPFHYLPEAITILCICQTTQYKIFLKKEKNSYSLLHLF